MWLLLLLQKQKEQNLGIVIDAYGAGHFMVCKSKMVASIWRTFSMTHIQQLTYDHYGCTTVGDELAKNILKFR